MERIVIDIDGTICTQKKDYKDAKPLKERIKYFNYHYDIGFEIMYFTARGSETGIDYRELTEKQFKEWGVKYHKLMFGKPGAVIYFDDKCANINNLRKGDKNFHC